MTRSRRVWLRWPLGPMFAALTSLGASAGEVQVDGRSFRVPDGFTVEKVAGPPLVERPIVADFDERGRLYVAESSGSNDPVPQQLAERPHRILRLEDTDGDGRFDKRTVFADRFMLPEGAMWRAGSLYVSAPPQIWKLTDADDDGVAEQRQVWFDGKTLTGCANDLHGPYSGPDGLIYWCKGAFAEQTYGRGPGQPPFVTRASHIFRRAADGSGRIEPVMTGGMDNPVDVVFTAGGERIFTTTFLQHPAGGRRDGLIHAIYGGVYGKVHDVLDGHVRTDPEVMPVLSHLGPAAPSGLTCSESGPFGTGFGSSYHGNLFAALFNLHKVTRHILKPQGAGLASTDEDFVTSEAVDFHPTDVIEDADGSLLVIDTGGWYKLCCPTSQLHKPDVLGAIYRVRRIGAEPVSDPRGQQIAWGDLDPPALARLLGDRRPAVRRRAIETLAERGAAAVPALAAAVEPEARGGIADGQAADQALLDTARGAAVVWTAGRIDTPEAAAVVRRALTHPDPTVRQAALNRVSQRRDAGAAATLRAILADTVTVQGPGARQPRALPMPPSNRRVAAEALGRIGDRAAVPDLLATAPAAGEDRAFEHAITYALIEIADRETLARALKSTTDPASRRLALIALDQLGAEGLEPKAVAAGLRDPDPRLRATTAWVLSRHPEWGDALADLLRDRLDAQDQSDAERAELEQALARFSGSKAVQGLLADRAAAASTAPAARQMALAAMAASSLKREAVPPAWIDALARTLQARDPAVVQRSLATARALELPRAAAPRLAETLRSLARDAQLSEATRLEALAAVPGGLDPVEPAAFDFLRARLAADRPVSERLAAADVLARSALSNDQLTRLAEVIATAGPLDVDRLLPAFGRSSAIAVGNALVAALQKSPALASLRADSYRPVLAKYGPGLEAAVGRLEAAIAASRADQAARLEAIATALPAGDIRRGQAVFNGTKAACASCHTIGYLGGKVGPDLTRIGSIRADRDLLEAIVYPSASFVRSYEPVAVATTDGRVLTGLLKRDAPEEVVLVTGADQEVRIARAEIETLEPGTVSVMPAGLDQQLSQQELADLITFLRACR